MNICITSSSNYDKYTSILIYMLNERLNKPTLIICFERQKYKVIMHRIKMLRLIRIVKKIFLFLKNSQSNKRDFLKEYALSNNIIGWNLSLSKICKREGIEYKKVHNINSKNAIKYINEKNIDLLLNAGGAIFKTPIINVIKMGILNAHMGFLPKFRGINVLEWSLFYNHKIGVTLHFIERGIDLGDILLFREIIIDKEDTITTLRAKSQAIDVDLMIECIELLRYKDIDRIKQLEKDGKQYFAMHPRLKEYVEMKLKMIHKK